MCYIPGSARECPICHGEGFTYYEPVRCLTYERCEWHGTPRSDLPKLVNAWFEKRVCKACMAERETRSFSSNWRDDDPAYQREEVRSSEKNPDKGKYRSSNRSPSPVMVESSASSSRHDPGRQPSALSSSSSRDKKKNVRVPSRQVKFADLPEEDGHQSSSQRKGESSRHSDHRKYKDKDKDKYGRSFREDSNRHGAPSRRQSSTTDSDTRHQSNSNRPNSDHEDDHDHGRSQRRHHRRDTARQADGREYVALKVHGDYYDGPDKQPSHVFREVFRRDAQGKLPAPPPPGFEYRRLDRK